MWKQTKIYQSKLISSELLFVAYGLPASGSSHKKHLQENVYAINNAALIDVWWHDKDLNN